VSDNEEIKGYNGHVYFTLDEIAHMLPGPARLMHEVGARWWKVYYAAKAGNWPLANYEVKELIELIEICQITRPKYEKFMTPFLNESLKPLKDAVAKQDWAAFDKAYHQATKDANDYHKAADKPLIRWKLPSTPPPDMEMAPEPQQK